jgi:hypothetical protein
MRDFKKELYQQFEGHPRFDFYFRFINPDQDGSYNVFGAFGDLLRDILIDKINDNELFLKQCAFIDLIISTQDPEWNNVMRSEVFSILDRKELRKLQLFLSKASNKELEIYL